MSIHYSFCPLAVIMQVVRTPGQSDRDLAKAITTKALTGHHKVATGFSQPRSAGV